MADGLDPLAIEAAESGGIELRAAAERMGGRLDVYARMLRSFARELPDLATALADPGLDREDALRTAHSIKGLAATLGHSALADVAAAAEACLAALPAHDPQSSAIQRLVGACAPAAVALTRLADALPASGPKPTPQPMTPAKGPGPAVAASASVQWPFELEALRQRLDDSDLDAMALLDRLRALGAEAWGPEWAALEQAVQTLDFESAAAHCRALMEATPWLTTPA